MCLQLGWAGVQEQEHPDAPPIPQSENIQTVDADSMDEESLQEVVGLLSHLEASLALRTVYRLLLVLIRLQLLHQGSPGIHQRWGPSAYKMETLLAQT